MTQDATGEKVSAAGPKAPRGPVAVPRPLLYATGLRQGGKAGPSPHGPSQAEAQGTLRVPDLRHKGGSVYRGPLLHNALCQVRFSDGKGILG